MKRRVWSMLTAMTLGALLIAAVGPSLVGATNSWNGYHWARTSNPFTLKLGNNTSGSWTAHLAIASSDWSQSSVLDTTVVAGATKPKSCRPTSGRVEVCNASYGNNGWLGLAQIWIKGGEHITQGIVKNNDYYFGSSSYAYNNEAEKLHVICQEIGHTLGLDHQSEDGSSQNSCMDYYHNTSDSDTLSTHPNQHDYDELAAIYAHVDSTSTVAASSVSAGWQADAASDWGKLVSASRDGRSASYERNLAGGVRIVTLVIWAR